MSPNTNIVHHQRPSCSKQTQDKASRLEVLNISRRIAIVAGSTSDYIVDFDTLTCSCRAGVDGLHCSHVLRAIMERSAMQGYGVVTFYDDARDAKLACVAQLKTGKRARLVSERGYVYVEAETPPPPCVGAHAVYNRSTGLFDVIVGGKVVSHATSYLEAERAA